MHMTSVSLSQVGSECKVSPRAEELLAVDSHLQRESVFFKSADWSVDHTLVDGHTSETIQLH